MNRIERYKEAKQNRKEGKFNGAPLYSFFERFGETVPVYPKGKQIMLLGGSGSGKTHLWIATVLFPVYYLIKRNGYKAKFIIFILEDTLEMFMDRLFCSVLFRNHGISIDPLELNSMRQNILSDEIEGKLEEVDLIVEDILSYCDIHDTVIKPFGMYMTVRTISNELGEHHYKDKEYTVKEEDGTLSAKTEKIYDKYVPTDPELHVFVIVDNVNNILPDDKDTRHEAIGKWYRNFGRLQICKHYNYTVINIQQTSLETDKKQFDMRGDSIAEKNEPTTGSLGNNLEVLRDTHLLIAIFSPARFGIDNYEGYNIKRLKDNFRTLLVLKSNFTECNIKYPFYMNGACSFFKELPKAKDMTEEVYKKIENKQIKDI